MGGASGMANWCRQVPQNTSIYTLDRLKPWAGHFTQSRSLERHSDQLEARVRELKADIDYWRGQAGAIPATNDPYSD